MSEKHVIETIADLFDLITEENAEEMVDNLAEWVWLTVAAKATGLPFSQKKLIWVNDGKHGLSSVRIQVETAAAGDTKEVEA